MYARFTEFQAGFDGLWLDFGMKIECLVLFCCCYAAVSFVCGFWAIPASFIGGGRHVFIVN